MRSQNSLAYSDLHCKAPGPMDFLPKTIAGYLLVLALCVCLKLDCLAQSPDFSLEAAGTRWGFSTSSRTHDFNQVEGFTDWTLPVTWDPCPKWHWTSRIEMAAGWLGGRGDDAFITTGAPCVLLRRDSIPLSLDLGSGLSLLSRERFGSQDFGTILQFSSHAGLNFDFGKHLQIGYRFQHMSNAHISDHNPGLNLHLLSICYRF